MSPILTAPQLCGALICGGLSTRMGCDKLGLTNHGNLLFENSARVIEEFCSQRLQVGRDLQLNGFELVKDEVEQEGPFMALISAMRVSQKPWLLCLAADMPAISSAFISQMIASINGVGSGLAFVPKSKKGLEPLCAIYNCELLENAEESFQQGQRSIYRWIDSISSKVVLLEALQNIESSVENLNTPEDYRRFSGNNLPTN